MDEQQIWTALTAVKDPEIPVVDVVGMGIVREVVVDGDGVTVWMTPTFAGCPALEVMRADIKTAVRALGAAQVTVETVYDPPWTSDWIDDATRAQLKAFGLAPPRRHGGDITITFYDVAECPYCDSRRTTVKNTFGPTLCRAIYVCLDCQEPFEQFKAL